MCCQVTENLAGGSINRQKRLSLQAAERCLALLSNTRVWGGFNPKSEFCNGNRGKIYRGVSRNRSNIRGGQRSLFDIDPDAGIDQETHGSRTSLSSRPAKACLPLSNHPVAASSGSVRYRSAIASSAVCRAVPGRMRATI